MTLLLKLLLAPALVVGSSLAGRRWGAQVTGVLVTLPIVAGPILLISCLEHGTAFGAAAAASSLLGLVTLALFAVVFAWCSRRLAWVGALAVAWSACLAADVLVAQVTVPAGWGLLLALAGIAAASRALPPQAASVGVRPATAWPWWDLPGRAAATATLVVLVTTLSSALGPAMTGVLAPFPIATSVVAAFVLARHGSAETVRTLRGVLAGLVGFTVFCFLVAVLVDRWGVAAAFSLALAVTVAGQLTWLRVRRARSDQRRSQRRQEAGVTGAVGLSSAQRR
ncbi:hypothetical protein Cme02nite_63680 [Catellatospora methionotrophica]|uniref:Uncharacterized protein n=1 Tax=Catellatospora methionotrophica TaxID=121620 RepID=A0A8J3LMI7_9ACTN|nr:hypothetical protein [Catellatospora methionotrophica]GIG18036.1 hypothetical protein Cme02nite_63680 [Catellatospora methionotrophica]